MKRPAKKLKPKVEGTFVLTWTRCSKCGSEFRFEFMYRSDAWDYCRSCAPSREEVVKLVEDRI